MGVNRKHNNKCWNKHDYLKLKQKKKEEEEEEEEAEKIPTKPTHEPNPQTMICKKLLININTHSIKSMDSKFSQSDRTGGKRKGQFTKHRITVMVFWLWYRTVCMYQSLLTMWWHSLLIMRLQLPMLMTMNDFDVMPLSKIETFSKESVSSIFRVMFPLPWICRQQVLVK